MSVVLFIGEDASRPLVERVGAFPPTVTDKVTALDAAQCEPPGIDPDVRALICPSSSRRRPSD